MRLALSVGLVILRRKYLNANYSFTSVLFQPQICPFLDVYFDFVFGLVFFFNDIKSQTSLSGISKKVVEVSMTLNKTWCCNLCVHVSSETKCGIL